MEAMFFSLRIAISLEGCVKHFSVLGFLTGNPAQLCSVCPPTILAATPDMAVLANSVDAPKFSVAAIAFPVAPEPNEQHRKNV